MSIFRRDPDTPSPSPPKAAAAPKPSSRVAPAAPASRDKTHIASGSKVVGEVSGSAELVIDGRVDGKIDLDSQLIVGPTGEVEGEVQARSIRISGRVMGNVRGLERVEVLKPGRLEGDMVAPQNGVHIAEGAFFSGNINMTRQPGQHEKKQPPPAPRSEAPEKREGSPAPGGDKPQAQEKRRHTSGKGRGRK